MFFRGVQLTVPLKANTQTDCVQVDLVKRGQFTHMNVSNGGEVGYPAHRLRIRIKYRAMDENTQKEFRSRTSAEGNIEKFNLLVSVLGDKDEDWTARQPRRFLGKNHRRKGSKHRTQVKPYGLELKVTSYILSSEDYYSYHSSKLSICTYASSTDSSGDIKIVGRAQSELGPSNKIGGHGVRNLLLWRWNLVNMWHERQAL